MVDNIIVLDQQKNREDYRLTNGLTHRIHWKPKLLRSVCSFPVFVSLSANPAIHSSVHPSILQILFHFVLVLCEREAVSLNLKSEGRENLTFFFPYLPEKQHRLYSLQLLSHLCPSSSFFLFSSSRLPPFGDLKITARHMTPLSSISLSLS